MAAACESLARNRDCTFVPLGGPLERLLSPVCRPGLGPRGRFTERDAPASAARREELNRSFELATADQVAAALGNMKWALMKLGQMASYLDDGLPQPVREALASLQQDALSMSPSLAAQVVETELGQPPDRLFDTWDELPPASASIGQVYRAVTHDGRAVAVKVQFPGVDRAIASDLANTDVPISMIGMLFPGLEPGPL